MVHPIEQEAITSVDLTLGSLNTTPVVFNPLNPYDALKHHFTSVKTHFIFLQLGVLK